MLLGRSFRPGWPAPPNSPFAPSPEPCGTLRFQQRAGSRILRQGRQRRRLPASPLPTDLQRHPEVYDLPARRLILGITSVGECGKTKMEDPARVAMVAVNDRSSGPELYGSRAHQLTPKGISGRGTSTYV